MRWLLLPISPNAVEVYQLDAIIEYCDKFPLNTAAAGFTIPATDV
jgi:hypothetical protein